MNDLLTDLIKKAAYCRVTDATGWRKHHGSRPEHLERVGRIENKIELARTGNSYVCSVNCGRPPVWSQNKSGVHHWVYPYQGDSVSFYDEAGNLLGKWDGLKQQLVTFTQGQNDANTTDEEGAKKLFTPTTVKAKGGYRAQVTFNNVVVWEADTVYTDDDNYKTGDYEDNTPGVGTSGQEKAQKAAAKAVDQAVEALFTKIKV